MKSASCQCLKMLVVWMVSVVTLGVHANSVSLSAFDYSPSTNQFEITLLYDFTEFAMFGGGVDLIYDASAMEFVSYVQAPLPADAQAAASPVGALAEPGRYAGAGIGTFEFFNGMTSAGVMGTFTFSVSGLPDPGNTSCGLPLCLEANAVNPFVSLAGDVVNDIIDDGTILPVPIPVPAALWLLLGALGVFRPAFR